MREHGGQFPDTAARLTALPGIGDSTAAAIARNERCDPDLEYVGRGIRLKYYEDETGIAPYLGIAAMPPGHYAAIDLSAHETLVPRPYYDLDAAWRAERPRLDSLPVGDLRTELFERLRHATMIRLRADVPIGISLSSGVDSTTVAALCAEAGVLPLGFIGTVAGLKDLDGYRAMLRRSNRYGAHARRCWHALAPATTRTATGRPSSERLG